MTASSKKPISVVAAIISLVLPPLISGPVFHAIRAGFHTVSVVPRQTPIENYLGDSVFFVVASAFLLLPWMAAKGFQVKRVNKWMALIPFSFLIACWLLNQKKGPIEGDELASWLAYAGYSSAAIGSVASERQDRLWLQFVWLPPMFFFVVIILVGWWIKVFFV